MSSQRIRALVISGSSLLEHAAASPSLLSEFHRIVSTNGIRVCPTGRGAESFAARLSELGDDAAPVVPPHDLRSRRALGVASAAPTELERICGTHETHIALLYEAGSLDLDQLEGLSRLVRVTADDLERVDLEALVETGWPDRLREDPWQIVEQHVDDRPAGYWESVLGLTNGYLGCRSTHDEPSAEHRYYPATFVNGTYSSRPYAHVVTFPGFATHYHGLVNTVDWRRFSAAVDGTPVAPTPDERTGDYARRLNMRDATVRRSYSFTAGAADARVTSTWFVSAVRPHLAAARYRIDVDDPTARVELEASIIPGPVSRAFGEARCHATQTGEHEYTGGRVRWYLLTIDGSDRCLAVAVHTAFSGTDDQETTTDDCIALERATIPGSGGNGQHAPEIRAGEIVRVISVVDGRAADTAERHDLIGRAVDELRAGVDLGFDALLAEHSRRWERVWQSIDVAIDGSVRDQQAVRYALFQLHSHGPTRPTHSVPATGLVGDGYGGHIFWDTEIYMLPFYSLTTPELSRRALMYRYHLLPKARKRAAELGAPGALYAWNSINGDECGVVFEASTAQYHINCAIAYAMWQFFQVTLDEDFLRDVATPVVWETAVFLSHLGEFLSSAGGAFCLNVVCGPDEYACGVDNNAYFNHMVGWHFRLALELLDRWQHDDPGACSALRTAAGLSDEEVDRMRRAEALLYRPRPGTDGVIAQDDQYRNRFPADMRFIAHDADIRELYHPLNLWRMQVTKQADVLLLFLLHPDAFDTDVKRANYDYYEPRTNHGSSLSPAVHSIIANDIGYAEAAYRYFRHASRLDLDDFKRNTWKGLHTACLGGTWLSVVYGFAGVRITPDAIRISPRLPASWRSLRFKLRYRGRLIAIHAEHGRAEATLLEGEPVTVRLNERPVALDVGEPVGTQQ